MFRLARTAPLSPFFLYRNDDVNGVSGTGVVAVGVLLPSGRAVMEWQSKWPTVTVFRSAEDIIRIHGHQGKTMLCWGLPPQGAPGLAGGRTMSLQLLVHRAAGWVELAKRRLKMKDPSANLEPH